MTRNIEQINQWFRQAGERIIRLRWILIMTPVLVNRTKPFGKEK